MVTVCHQGRTVEDAVPLMEYMQLAPTLSLEGVSWDLALDTPTRILRRSYGQQSNRVGG
jgi:hypothetical protein